MKKLTAGILTVMLGIVAANSADASIASKGYVDAQVKTSVSNETFNTFKTENTAAIDAAKKAGTDAAAALETYKTSNDAAVAKKADTETVNAELAKKQNTLTAADFVKDGTGNVVTSVTVGDDGKIKYTTESVATSAELGNLQTTVAGHTTALDKLNGTAETEGSVANSIANALKDYTTTANMNTALGAKADKSTIGTVPEGKTVVKMIEEAQTSATYDDTALKGRVDTIEKSAAYTSGINAEKVAQIETNKTGVAENKAAVAAVTKDLADNYTKTASLSDLATATIPATCTDPNAANGCALILKNGVYSWEVVERDAENQ